MTIHRDEEGSALILALILITVIGLILAASLSFADSSLVGTPAFVGQRNTLNDVDGAVEAAINSIRGSTLLGSSAASAPVCGPFAPYAGTAKSGVTVDCAPQAGSGSAADEQPPFAILTTGPAPNGLIITGNGLLTVDGGMYSNGVIDLTQPGAGSQLAVQAFGDIRAEAGCLPSLASNGISAIGGGTVDCDTGNKPLGDTPTYTPGAPSVSGMAVDPPVACNTSTSFVRFSPGVYTEVPKPRKADGSTCGGGVWWFQPGIYYFDFPDNAPLWTPDDLTGKTVIGGTLANGLTAASTQSDFNALRAATPPKKACDVASPNGAQFIFGGASQLSISSHGYLEVCAGKSTTNYLNHQIALFGLDSGVRSSVGPAALAVATVTTPATAGKAAYAPAVPGASVTVIDNSVYPAGWHTAPLSTSAVLGKSSADIKFAGFGPVPAGSKIESAKLNIRHYGSNNQVSPSVTVNRGSLAGSLTKFQAADCVSGVCTDSLTFTPSAGGFAYEDINNLIVTYSASVGGSNPVSSDNLDGIELVVKYLPPAFEAVRCPTAVATCSMVTSTVNLNLFFRGTVFAPSGTLDLTVHNNDTTIFGRGVIAKTLKVDNSSSSKQTDSPFQLPNASTNRTVLFTGKVDGTAKIRALVKYQDFVTDASGLTSSYPGYRVTVLNWSVLR
jgi:hypothetical protein